MLVLVLHYIDTIELSDEHAVDIISSNIPTTFIQSNIANCDFFVDVPTSPNLEGLPA